MRRRNPKPAIVFLASHGSEVDRMSGWRVQADEYITKPVSPEYLPVRVEALLRRIDTLNGSPPPGNAAAAPVPAPDIVFGEQASIVH